MSRFWSGVFDVLPLMPPPRGEVREKQLPWPLFESSPVALHGLHYRYVGHSEHGDCGFPGSHSLACARLVAASRQAGYLT